MEGDYITSVQAVPVRYH